MKFSKNPILAAIFLCISTLALAQPANDNCATAQNLGSLPTPQSCTAGPIPTRGIGATQVTNTTNLAATPSNPYISMTGCQQGNASTSSPASDVWYSVTLTGSELNVTITGGINQPNFALWQGACGSLVGLGCATGTAGSLTTQFTGLVPGTYLIQVSGNNNNDRGNFQMTLSNDNNCAACLVTHTLTVSPLPTNGYYQAGTPVTFCFRVTGWTQQAVNWLLGVEVTFGAGWNVGSVVATPPSSSCDGTVGTWGWYPGGCTSTATSVHWNNGFYFDRDNNGNPGDNFGDNCSTGSAGIGDWIFCLTVTPKACGSPGFSPDLSLSFNTLADGEAGSWGSIACQNDPDVFFSAQTTCCPEPILANTNVLCNGACTATATATGQGPTGPWNYTWINMAGMVTIRTQNGVAGADNMTGLCAGSYIVRAVNTFDGCTAQDTFTVTQPALIIGTPAVVNVLCNGGNTGSITINATAGGVGPYQYSLNGGPFQGSNAFTGLTAGTYTVTIRDANLCTITINNIVVSQPAVITGTPVVVNVLCNGASTGSITITPTAGGVGPYQYSLNGGPFQGSNAFTGLAAGTYTVTIRDANLCTVTINNIIVNQPAAITGTPVVVNVLCNGANTGSITITPTAGGVGPYQYSLNGGPFQGSNAFTGLAAGTYTVTIRDANLCTVTINNIVVSQPAPITGTPVVVNVLCNGASTGSITITPTAGGVGPYQYSLNGGPFQGSNAFTGLPAGTYTVTIRDANLCTVTINNIVVSQPAVITGTPVVVNVLCNGASTGSITITPTAGGVGPYQYSLNGGPFQGSNAFTGLPAGTYTVTIRDANLCTVTINNIIVSQPAVITGTPVVVNVLCNGGNTGSITINPTAGGVGPYQYSLNGGPFQGSNAFTGLTAGTYTVTIRDANLCTVTITNIIVSQPAAITGTPAVVNATGCASNGSITINATAGGVGPYQYSLNGGPFQVSNVFNGLAAGTYTVTIRDANLCTVTITNIIVSSPAAITGTPAVVNVTCNGGNNGSITINGVSGGTGPYQYSLNGGPFGGSNVFSGLTAGTYTVTIRDVNLCTLVLSNIIVTQPALITGTPAVVNVLCNGGNTGSITINATAGGVGPYQYSLNGGPFQVSNIFPNLIAGTYTVTIRDASLCTVTLNNIVVNQPAAITGTPVVVNVLCNGGNTGSITINPTAGGVGPYQYSLSGGPFQGSNAFTGLTAGTYTVTIRDANLCTITITNIVVSQPAAITGTPAVVNATGCANDGSITINATAGGVGPYQYSLNGGPFQVSNAFPNLAAGTYTVTIRDANLCTVTLSNIIITAPGAITGTPVVVNVTCNGGNDGSITINATSGGTGPYQYSLNGGPFGGSNAFTNLTAGTYTVTIRDVSLCTLVLSNIIVTEPAAITGTPAVVDVLCNGGNTGSITINATAGGVGPYQYSLNGGPFGGANAFTNLTAGTYTVTIHDASLCTVTLSNLVVNQPAALAGTPVTVNVTCNGANDGSITLTNAAGGVGPYQYSLNGGPLQSGNAFTGLAPGIYTVTLQDANACTLPFTQLTITEPAAITAIDSTVVGTCVPGNDGQIWILNTAGGTPNYQYSLDGGSNQLGNSFTTVSGGAHTVTVTDQNGCTLVLNVLVPVPGGISATDSLQQVTCNGAADGEIWVNATGGQPSYQYSINAGPLQVGNSFINLGPGNYTVLVQDQLGCAFSMTSIITEPTALAATDSTVGASCTPGNDGEIWILGSTGGLPSYQYSLNGGPFQSGTSFTGLNGGSFIVTLRDSSGCTFTLNPTVSSPGNVSATDTVINPVCFAGQDGQIIVTGVSSAQPVQYSFNGGPFQASGTFTNLPSGVYNIDVRDALGCTITIAAQVSDPPQLLGSTIVTPLTCANAHDGQISVVNVTGGTGGYMYQINNALHTNNNTFVNLAAGNYQITIYDSLGCSVIMPVTVTSPQSIGLTSSFTQASCGNPDGTATVVATGGTPGYTYLWSNGQSTATATAIAAGPITVTVTDANGCTATRTVTVTNANAPTMTIVGTNDVTCFGDNDGWVAVSVIGGNAPYQYAWNTSIPVNNDTLAGVGGGTWSVTVTDANGCILTDSATLSEPPLLVVTPDSIAISCFGQADGQAFVTASGGTAPYFYAWSNGGASDTLSNLSAGIYDVTVTDAHGCTATASISLSDPLPVNAAFNATPAMPAQLQIPNANATFLNMSQNANSYVWTFGDGGTSNATDPTHSYTIVGDYCVMLVARDSAGCADTVQQCNYNVWQQELEIPNTFTPNNDGRNDFFQILGIGLFPNNHLQVFNRWGNLVYEKDKYDNTWDGSNIKNGAALPDGAYFYIFKTGVEGQDDILGDVVIFR